MKRLISLVAIAVVAVAVSPVFADPITVGALGDSLTDPYSKFTAPGLRGSNGDRNWVELLQHLRPGQVAFADVAVSGATSQSLLDMGQPTTVAGYARGGTVQYATLFIGANDILGYFNRVAKGGSPNFADVVGTLFRNVATAVDTLEAAGNVRLVLGTIPDIGQTPYFRGLFHAYPAPCRAYPAADRPRGLVEV